MAHFVKEDVIKIVRTARWFDIDERALLSHCGILRPGDDVLIVDTPIRIDDHTVEAFVLHKCCFGYVRLFNDYDRIL